MDQATPDKLAQTLCYAEGGVLQLLEVLVDDLEGLVP